MATTFLGYRRPASSSFTETGVDTNAGAYLEFPAVIPNTQHLLAFVSYEANVDHRGHLLGLESASSSDGWRLDDNTSDGFTNPEIDFLLAGDGDDKFVSSGNYTSGNRLNILISGTISGSVATSKVVIWDEASSTATQVFNVSSAASVTSYDWDRYAIAPGLFAGAGGQRETDSTIYRFAYWDDADLTGAPPDINSGSVQDNFFNSSTGALVDPATSQSAYGTPLYDIYGAASVYNAGTNLGGGSDWTKAGSPSFL